MQDTSNTQVKFIPAICTKCGAQLDVDPTQDAAVCPYCGAAFVVDKAVQNYTVQNAKIDHVDTVNVDLKGSVDSVVGMAERMWNKSREDRKELKQQQAESSKEFFKNSWKIFAIMFGAMILLWVLGNVFGFFK